MTNEFITRAQRYSDSEATILGQPTKPVTQRFLEWYAGRERDAAAAIAMICRFCERPATVRETVTYTDRVSMYAVCECCRTPFADVTR